MEEFLRRRLPPSVVTAVARRSALRVGFGLVLALGMVSMLEAIRIQRSLSAATADIYQQHVKLDEVLIELRRTFWLASIVARDYLIDPSPDREKRYERSLQALMKREEAQIAALSELPHTAELKQKSAEFWRTLERVPRDTDKMTPEARYQYVQQEIAARRSILGDLVRDWVAISQTALKESEQKFEASRRSAANRLAWILGASVLFGLLVAFLSLRYSEHLERKAAEHFAQVAQAKDELAHLSTRLMEVQEEERARLARELHDEIGQGLATFRLEVARAEALPENRAGEIKARLGRARALADSTVQTVRNICLLLRPSMLDDLGLIPAIQWLAEDFSRRGGVACDFQSSNVSDELSEPVRTCVYRVVQEALHNCEKHAAASHVAVRVDQHEGELTATIEDNGCGFELNANQGPEARRFGLMGMRERAGALGGALEVLSSPGAGTRVRLSLPSAHAGVSEGDRLTVVA
jgi:signal transduction histidine kinase